MVKGLFCQLVHSFISPNATLAETSTRAFIAQYPEDVHDIENGEGSQYIHPQSFASMASSQSGLLHQVILPSYTDNNPVPQWRQ